MVFGLCSAVIIYSPCCGLFIEAGGFHMFFYVISKVLMSTLLTVLVLVILQYLFYSKGRFS